MDVDLKKTYTIKLWSFEIEILNLKKTSIVEHLQAISVFLNLLFISSGVVIVPWLTILLLYTRLWFLVPLYAAWIYYDRHTAFNGGRKINWIRRMRLFKHFRDYFPVTLIKTTELPPDKNYLFITYPHGVLPMSVLANFASEANECESKIFPGIDLRIITLDVNFYTPIAREYFMSLGGCAASESSLIHLLTSKPSKSVVLVAGGAAEAGLARPGNTCSIITSRRKGFVRIALKTGVSIVPMFSFGENNLYDQYNTRWLTVCKDIVYRVTGIQLILPKGRGFFQNSFGILPQRKRINTVVGKPIPIPKIENPSKEQIDEYHSKFFKELYSLFEKYKHDYDPAGSNAKLIMQ
ncbi:hypothetical protein PGB90_006847 [Kerria lacca]